MLYAAIATHSSPFGGHTKRLCGITGMTQTVGEFEAKKVSFAVRFRTQIQVRFWQGIDATKSRDENRHHWQRVTKHQRAATCLS